MRNVKKTRTAAASRRRTLVSTRDKAPARPQSTAAPPQPIDPTRILAREIMRTDVLVLNALLPRPHPLHLSVPEAVALAQQLGARRTLLTHLTHETPHAELAASLPARIEPAFDGLVVDVAAA